MFVFKKDPALPVLALLCYIALIPCTLFCAAHLALVVLMCVLALTVMLVELVAMVDRQVAPNDVTDSHSLVHDVVVVARVLCTTLLPAALATFGGASFFLVVAMGPVAENCKVASLPLLAKQGFVSFACTDGFVLPDLQVGVPAWQDLPAERRRLGDTRGGELGGDVDGKGVWTASASEGDRLGFVMPVFDSRRSFDDGKPLAAWAVKAGQPVRRSDCDDGRLTGTCGIFASRLQASWSGYPAPRFFGKPWGFNITHFSASQMRRASRLWAELRGLKERDELPAETDQAFIIVEPARAYFGPAYPALCVVLSLFGLGLLDRLGAAADSRALYADTKRVEPSYAHRLVQQQGPPPEAGLAETLSGFWNDPLNTSRASAALQRTLEMRSGPEAPGADHAN
uniref:Uncharacterized protein n=1 Tax=Zooxanthella nutricula TaxID=1333877 RepID=A0A7S2KY14_9DINO